ncbi:hypothetical protein X975_19537, partial [Stegodyphus mimosarum]
MGFFVFHIININKICWMNFICRQKLLLLNLKNSFFIPSWNTRRRRSAKLMLNQIILSWFLSTDLTVR